MLLTDEIAVSSERRIYYTRNRRDLFRRKRGWWHRRACRAGRIRLPAHPQRVPPPKKHLIKDTTHYFCMLGALYGRTAAERRIVLEIVKSFL
jgi:hypothetical protein